MVFQNFKRPLEHYGTQERNLKKFGLDIAVENRRDFFADPLRFFVYNFAIFYMVTLKVVYAIKYFPDVDDIAEPLILLMAGMLTFEKFYFFFLNVCKFYALKTQLETLPADSTDEEKLIWRQYSERGQKLVICLDILLFLTFLVLIIIRPIITTSLIYMETGKFQPYMPLKAYYPYDHTTPVGFLITFCINWLAGVYVCTMVSITDGTFCWLIFAVSARVAIMREKLKAVGEKIKAHESTKKFKNELKEIIKYQQKLYMWNDSLNETYSLITLSQIWFCTMQFCFIIFLWNTEIDILLRLHLLTVGPTMLLQIAMYCFGGEKLLSESESVYESIYLSIPVEYIEPEMKRFYLGLLICSLKPMELQGGHFFVATRALFVSIIKTAFSYAAFVGAQK